MSADPRDPARADARHHVLFGYVGTGRGGSYVSSAMLVQALRKRGHRVDVWVPHPSAHTRMLDTRDVEYACYLSSHDPAQSPITTLGRVARVAFYLRVLPAALGVLQRTRPDVVHVNDGPSCLVWGAAARLTGVPLVWHVRVDIPGNLADRVRLRLADRLVFVADTIRQRFQTAHSAPSVTVVNGVDTCGNTPLADRSGIRAELGLPADACVLGFVGTLNATKRPAWAIEALVQARPTNSAAYLVLVGSDEDGGATAARLRAQAEQAGVAEAVHLAGYRSDVPRLLPAFDLLLLPSRSEAMPRVVLEAMACAVPAVATRVGGTPEIITSGTDGWLVDPHDRAGFADTVTRLVRDRDALSRAGQAARETVVRRFDHTHTVAQIEAIYDALRGSPN